MPEWFEPSKNIILLVLAVWGAALSTFNWWNARSKDRQKVLVTLNSLVTSTTDTLIKVEAVNIGHRPVTIEYIAIQLPDKRTIPPAAAKQYAFTPSSQLPLTLKDGENACAVMSYRQLGEALSDEGVSKTRIYPFATDSAGNKYRGKPWDIDVGECLRM